MFCDLTNTTDGVGRATLGKIDVDEDRGGIVQGNIFAVDIITRSDDMKAHIGEYPREVWDEEELWFDQICAHHAPIG